MHGAGKVKLNSFAWHWLKQTPSHFLRSYILLYFFLATWLFRKVQSLEPCRISFNPLGAKYKMVKHIEIICRQQLINCFSVFDHFVELALKGLIKCWELFLRKSSCCNIYFGEVTGFFQSVSISVSSILSII